MLENKEGLPWSAYVGVAGMPGRSSEQFLANPLMNLLQAKLRGTPGKNMLTPRRQVGMLSFTALDAKAFTYTRETPCLLRLVLVSFATGRAFKVHFDPVRNR